MQTIGRNHELPILQRFNLCERDLTADPRFEKLLDAKQKDDAEIFELKTQYGALDEQLRQRGREIVILGLPRAPEPSKRDPLKGLSEVLVAATMKDFSVRDEDLKDIRFGWLLRGIVIGRVDLSELKRRIPVIKKLLAKLDINTAPTTAQPENK